MGWNIMFKCFYLFFCDFLRSSGEHIFGSIATVFASNDVFRWGLIVLLGRSTPPWCVLLLLNSLTAAQNVLPQSVQTLMVNDLRCLVCSSSPIPCLIVTISSIRIHLLTGAFLVRLDSLYTFSFFCVLCARLLCFIKSYCIVLYCTCRLCRPFTAAPASTSECRLSRHSMVVIFSLSLSLFIRKEMQTIKNTKSSKTQNYTKHIYCVLAVNYREGLLWIHYMNFSVSRWCPGSLGGILSSSSVLCCWWQSRLLVGQ